MKRVAFGLSFAVVIGAVGWGVWTRHEATLLGAKPVNLHPAPLEMVMSKNWQEVRAARVLAFQNNPDLTSQYQQILKAMNDQRKKLDAAMIQANLKIAPLIAKQQSGNTALTSTELRELLLTRQAAFKANPDLVAKSAQLSKKMNAFRSTFTANMIKTDPKVAPMLAKLGDVPPAHQPDLPPKAQ
jgi:hypothetical protein